MFNNDIVNFYTCLSVHIYTYFQFLLYFLCNKVFMSFKRSCQTPFQRDCTHLYSHWQYLSPGFLVGV